MIVILAAPVDMGDKTGGNRLVHNNSTLVGSMWGNDHVTVHYCKYNSILCLSSFLRARPAPRRFLQSACRELLPVYSNESSRDVHASSMAMIAPTLCAPSGYGQIPLQELAVVSFHLPSSDRALPPALVLCAHEPEDSSRY